MTAPTQGEREARWPERCPVCSHDFGRDAVVFDLATHVAVRHADEMKAWLAALSTQEEAGADEQAPDIDETRDFDAAWIANACALYVKHARRTEAGRCPCKGCSDIRERLAPQVAQPGEDSGHRFTPEHMTPAGVVPACSCGWRGNAQLGGWSREQWDTHMERVRATPPSSEPASERGGTWTPESAWRRTLGCDPDAEGWSILTTNALRNWSQETIDRAARFFSRRANEQAGEASGPVAGSRETHEQGCALRCFTYEVGSGETIPVCTCARLRAPAPGTGEEIHVCGTCHIVAEFDHHRDDVPDECPSCKTAWRVFEMRAPGTGETDDWPRLRAVFERIWPTLKNYMDGRIGDIEVAATLERLLRAPGTGTEEVDHG